MANTREVRLRIRSVKNIAQVTRALQAVSASKVRKAMQAVYILGVSGSNQPVAPLVGEALEKIGSCLVDDEISAAELQDREVNSVAAAKLPSEE